ncbi:hypothetical protein HDU96_000932 [Phlyctochytrium bullatum]|nr:hypothetical protein HDU96_000932 [Phlyctochytrium bullatum]
MSSPASFETHKKSLYLLFSATCPAYAEVATFLLAKGTLKTDDALLKLGLHREVDAPESHLIIPAGVRATNRSTLYGKSAVVRYLVREFSKEGKLYQGLPIESQNAIDQWLDLARNLNKKDDAKVSALIKLAESKVAKLAVTRDKLTLSEVLVWDFARQFKGKSAKVDQWVGKVESVKEFKKAVELVEDKLSSVHLLDEYRSAIVNKLSDLTSLPAATISPLLECKIPKDASGADFIVAVPRLRIQGNPNQVAQDLASKFTLDEPFFERAEASGIFIRFFIKREHIRDTLIPRVLKHQKEYGWNAAGFGKMAVVEFSSPNIAKPFHVGHLRSTIIGNFIQKVLTANGWSTISMNYLGDWGTQYGLLALGYMRFGDEKKLIADPIKHLYDVYVAINKEEDETKREANENEARAYFGRMESGDQEALGLWKRFRDLSIVKYTEVYGRVNVNFDIYSGESHYSASQMRGVVDRLDILGLLSLSDGARIVDLKQYKLGAAIIEKRDGGGMLYISRDIAAAIDRQTKYKFDNMYYVVGMQQEDHFKKLFKILQLMGIPWADRCKHIGFGMIKTKDGNMSTRKGTVVFLEDILNNTQESMLEVMRKNEVKFRQIEDPNAVSDLIGITAVMVQDMSARRVKDYEFEWERVLSFEGDTGPYLQYAHARLCSIERNAAALKTPVIVTPKTDLSPLTEPSALALLDLIALYPDIVREASISLEPCNIVSYAFKLAHAVMVALENLYVLNQPPQIAEARLAMYAAARITIGNALSSLGIIPLERM